MAKKKPSLLAKKIGKIRKALTALDITISKEDLPLVEHLVGLCEIGDDLAKELSTHSGVYAYMAAQQAALQNEIDGLESQREIEQRIFDGLCDFILIQLRRHCKITGDQKKEIISTIRLGEFTNTFYYHEIEDEVMLADVKNAYVKATHSLQLTIALAERLLVVKAKKLFIDQVVSALGYQRNMCLRTLTELQIVGLRQEIA